MISKLVKGGGFKGAARYIAKEGSQEICSNNLFTDKPETRAGEFRAVADSAATKKPVMHVSLSLPKDEKATDEQWKIAAETYLSKMGFDLEKTQYQVTRHTDSENDHIHILANRVMLDGQVLSDKNDFKRSHEATRAAEKAANLPQYEKGEKTNSGQFHDLQEKITSALKKSGGDFDKFTSELKKSDIEFKLNRNESGRPTGAMFVDKNRAIPGSQIARQFSIGGLQKAGLKIPQNTSVKSQPAVSHLPTSSRAGSVEGWSKGNDGSTSSFLNNVERQTNENLRAQQISRERER